MSDFSVISEISNEILKVLRENICPELIQSSESVKLVTPTDKSADFQLGLYLYDIQEMREFKQMDLIRTGANKAKFPGRPLNLFYALYINSKSQMMADAESEQRIIGRSIQILMDHTVLNNSASEDSDEEEAAITFLTMSFEDKSKLWSVLSMPYQLAVYFTVSPVILSSRRTYSFTRVLQTEFDVSQKEVNPKDKR